MRSRAQSQSRRGPRSEVSSLKQTKGVGRLVGTVTRRFRMTRNQGFVSAHLAVPWIMVLMAALLHVGAFASDRIVHQIERADGVGLVLTGINIDQPQPLAGAEIGLWMYTPDFQSTPQGKGEASTVVIVRGEKVAKVLRGAQALRPLEEPIPADGYVLIGSGIAHRFLQEMTPGDRVRLTEKAASTPEPLPKWVGTEAGSTYAISALNRGRLTDELIVFTPDFGTHTMTNGWGGEAAVVAGKVVALRPYGDDGLFAIPQDGFVVSAHGAARSWFERSLGVGASVTLLDASGVEVASLGAGSDVPSHETVDPASQPASDTTGQSKKLEFPIPIVHQPLQHEEELFDYHPWYIRNDVSFDSHNRPYIRSRTTDLHETGFIQTLQDGRWVNRDFTQAVKAVYRDFDAFVRGAGWHGARIVFDADDDLYTLVRIRLNGGAERNVLLYSTDYGQSFQVYELPNGEFDIEHWVGHNLLHRPPLIGIFEFRAAHPQPYASVNNFYVIQPTKQDGQLILTEPVLVSQNALSPSRHSGHASFAVSGEESTFITWIDVADQSLPGAPTYVATYDVATNTVGQHHQLVYAPPVNDNHNTPGVCIDSKGYLHVISGSHGANFYYLRSLKPYSADDGWTEPEPVLTTGAKGSSSGPTERGRQTYLSLVCDANDTLHIAYRQWREGVDPYFGGRLYGALSYQSKPADGGWSEPTVLVVPAVPVYSVFYHKLSLDRLGRLYLSYSFKSPEGPYAQSYENSAQQYNHRAMLFSPDAGASWQLAASKDFADGVVMFNDDGSDLSNSWAAPGQIAGQVTDDTGAPVSGAHVSLGPKRVVTDAAGRFTVTDIYADEATVSVQGDGYHLWRSAVSFPTDEPLQLNVTLTSSTEEAVDLAQLWSAARIKLFVRLEGEGPEWKVAFLSPSIAGVTFEFQAEEQIHALAFEARIEPNSGSMGQLKATIGGTGGDEEVVLSLDRNWREYRLSAMGDLTRAALLMEKGNNPVIGIRNVRLVK